MLLAEKGQHFYITVETCKYAPGSVTGCAEKRLLCLWKIVSTMWLPVKMSSAGGRPLRYLNLGLWLLSGLEDSAVFFGMDFMAVDLDWS